MNYDYRDRWRRTVKESWKRNDWRLGREVKGSEVKEYQ